MDRAVYRRCSGSQGSRLYLEGDIEGDCGLIEMAADGRIAVQHGIEANDGDCKLKL